MLASIFGKNANAADEALSVMRREASVGKHLPYSHHHDPHTVAAHDGRLMQIIRLDGLFFETADSEALSYRKQLRDAMLQAIGSSEFAIYHHIIRRQVSPQLAADFPDDYSAQVDRAWRARLGVRQLYVNDLYLTLVKRPMQGRVGWLDRLRIKAAADRQAAISDDLRRLSAARDTLMAALASYGPRLLGVIETPDGLFSEPLEFLSSLLNGETRPVMLPMQDLADYLPYRRISFGQQTIETAAYGATPARYSALVSVKDYTPQTSAGMFDELLRLPYELTISQSFGFVGRDAALGTMNLALRRMRAADDEAISLRGELAQAKDDVAAGRAQFGEHHMTIAVHCESPAGASEAASEVLAALSDLGIVGVREEVGLEPAFWAQLPGNFKYVARRALVSTSNFAGLASGHNYPAGKAAGNHWGAAVTLLETTGAGPYFFNFHQGDLGNFTVIGPSGSGKTVLLNFLLAQARKFAPRIIFFDKDRGAELFIRAIGGRYDVLRPGTPAGLNPLAMEDTPANRQFLRDWLAVLAGGVEEDERAMIAAAVDANFKADPAMRQLQYLTALFRGQARPVAGDLWSRLVPWWGEGERAWLFDNAEDDSDIAADTVGFDMTQLLDQPVLRTPAMMYLFHRTEERLDGTPAIIVVDEGWKALDDEVFTQRIKDWEKTIRKRNGIVGFATQSAQDALESRISSAIIEQAATQIFMVNPKAQARDYCDGFGLTSHEFDLVRALPDNAHCFLIKHGNESVVARLNLAGDPNIITILSGRERSVRLLDAIRAETGDDPADWLPRLLERA